MHEFFVNNSSRTSASRSHLRDIRDRSVLRLFESPDINGGGGGAMPVGTTPLPGGLPAHPSPSNWDQDQSYFSEPEFDSEYQHQHIHKSKVRNTKNTAITLISHKKKQPLLNYLFINICSLIRSSNIYSACLQKLIKCVFLSLDYLL